jgi:hypothetical protein
MKSLLFTAILSLRKRSEQLLIKFAILLQVRLTHAQTFFRGVALAIVRHAGRPAQREPWVRGWNKINLQNVQFLMPNNFRKYPLKQEQFKDFQVLLYKLKDFQGLAFYFPYSRTFNDF